ncbi:MULTISPECIES: intradiol ring-cleavage dioxygenase [unclassified Duganella]|uniref:intradiol ring-cleavage dioxygenase n=1 Tax=unclassified Duganella TaxID=2636909 RepID=UPI000700077F|nr:MULTISPECIES: intradiol ring-cleavage dioxygenase [unclassified Duganella]KQV59351.1 intradiol ring-cleavage dioxygenase [Duganella sp. Root336D2]KRC01447.1 intradiol ring-cleavage dioxygenase [Duganella sp. Root198D2]
MDAHDHGLAADLEAMMNMGSNRRRSLRWLLASAATLPLVACGGGADSTSAGSGSSGGSAGTSTSTGGCTVIPEETGGPYPGDGTNSNASGIVNVLTQSGIVRSDIRGSFNGASGTAAGIPLTIKLKIINANNSCGAAGEFAVYLWHCDREGRYSLYSSGVTDQNYLRGVQGADANGDLSFTTIFPGCYDGRMPHVHFEVYRSLAQSSSASNRIKTSQFTFPMATLNQVYATSAYSSSASNLSRISYATDNIFSDGYSLQLGTMSGNVADGYVVTLTVAVAA